MAEIDRWALERACWARGIALVCGCDEAGAGPLAGAVYAGAVILPPECSIEGLNDSKQVTPKRRDALYDTIRTVAVAWAVARVEAEEIDATISSAPALRPCRWPSTAWSPHPALR